MKLLKAVTHTSAALAVLSLYLLNFPTRATFFGAPEPLAVALFVPLLALAPAIVAARRADLRWGLGFAGLCLLLAASASVPALTAGSVLFALSLLVFAETLSAAHGFATFEAEARKAGAEPTLTADAASRQYLRFAWWPLLLTALVAVLAAVAHLLAPFLGLPAAYGEAVELRSAYGIILAGLAVLGLFGLLILARKRVASRRA